MQFARERERERKKEKGCCESSSLHIELGPQYGKYPDHDYYICIRHTKDCMERARH